MQTINFTFNNKKYIMQNSLGFINIFAEGEEEAICNGYRDELNTDWNDSEFAKKLYKYAITNILE